MRDNSVDENFNFTENSVERENQGQPPPTELLKALDDPYSDWKEMKGPFQITIVVYDCLEGSNLLTSKAAWIQVLKQVEAIHSINNVHGDLLPRNFIFDEERGWVLDFDLTRKVDQRYVSGYNHEDFRFFRHENAKAGLPMKKDHDVWSLKQLSKSYFGLDRELDDFRTVSHLVKFFEDEDLQITNPQGWS